MTNSTKISKQMAYLLRHNPSGLKISNEGFVDLDELIKRLNERWPDLTVEEVKKIVEEDPKGRYEIRNDEIRARYGHSIDVKPSLKTAKVERLYHGTTSKASQKILNEGLKSKGRKKVHLSKHVEDAIEVGKRRTENPVILKINAASAREAGIKIEKASKKVYVAGDIPSKFISIEEKI